MRQYSPIKLHRDGKRGPGRQRALTPRLTTLEGRVLLSTTIGVNITGTTSDIAFNLNGGPKNPPDTMGAVGPDRFVEFLNGVFAVYDKATGALVERVSDQDFWIDNNGVAPSVVAAGLTDTRILFDPASQRWFALEETKGTNTSILLARSDTTDPAGSWKDVGFKGFLGDTGLSDQPTLGLDADAIYISTNDFSSDGTPLSVSFFSIPKADILASTPTLSRATAFEDLALSTYGLSLQGAVDFGPSNGHGVVYSTAFGTATQIGRMTVNNPGGAHANNGIFPTPTGISVATYSMPPAAFQPDGTQSIITGGTRISGNVYQVGNLVYMAQTTAAGGRAAIRWRVLNETTNAVVQEGTIGDADHDYYYPSIAANANGDVVIGYTRSGTTEYASSYASVGRTSGGVISFDAPLLLNAGVASVHLNQYGFPDPQRWGDYSATTLDPSNPSVFWTIQEFADGSSTWATQITQLTVAHNPAVAPVNHNPALSPIADQTIAQGGTVSVTAQATDPDAGQSLTYSLGAGAPPAPRSTRGPASSPGPCPRRSRPASTR